MIFGHVSATICLKFQRLTGNVLDIYLTLFLHVFDFFFLVTATYWENVDWCLCENGETECTRIEILVEGDIIASNRVLENIVTKSKATLSFVT